VQEIIRLVSGGNVIELLKRSEWHDSLLAISTCTKDDD